MPGLAALRPAAFTLIELLVAVSIIGILAAIALPNFLQARTRARVASTSSDLRSLAHALAAYRVDNGQYPPGPIPAGPPALIETWRLSTPVAWIDAIPADRFVPPPGNPFAGGPFGLTGAYLHYLNGENEPRLEEAWLLFSYGPDADMEPDAIHYDPTNGAISNGDLYRTGPRTRLAESAGSAAIP